ncbi:endonuclease [Mangrovimonas sp. CR14]|uniref:endonuclease/exonuclease/phosphatase family protein n=1 Tax=Mangrovimonas sp. CR14 TaxID=2706120 RepID=UPI00141F8B84|nr:endonuclease [Mangrovimonas sp. CR14]NIK91108.1 endonuclease [Mangrovimonas sp. CR14]
MPSFHNKKQYTVAFYNLENLFDTYDDELTQDNEFLPDSVKKWTFKRYLNKLRKLGFAISQIGENETGFPPALVGLSEVENELVLRDLISSQHLAHIHYDFVHFDSPDERGIDVALLYNKKVFHKLKASRHALDIFNVDGEKDYTRDILHVSGLFDGEKVHVIVNHWPSRREGLEESNIKRMAASNKVMEIMETILYEEPEAKFIILGDFNDNPDTESIKNLVNNQDLFNPMEQVYSKSRGTTRHDFVWDLFDQIILSTSFFERIPGTLTYLKADIFDEDFLKLFRGPFKGEPFRTYVGTKYKGGYSDHFPVYLILHK